MKQNFHLQKLARFFYNNSLPVLKADVKQENSLKNDIDVWKWTFRNDEVKRMDHVYILQILRPLYGIYTDKGRTLQPPA